MKVSVVIPAYNEEKHIGKCLQHLLHQQEMADEIIVVDNNSADKTAAIAKQYGVRVIPEKNQGMTPARDAGFNAAKYEIIARTDADTYVPPDWIKRIKENFTDPTVVGVTGTTHFYDFFIHNALQFKQWENKLIFRYITWRLKNGTLYGPNMAIRKSAWEKIAIEVCNDDKNIHEDTDLAVHMRNLGRIIIDPKLIVETSFRRWKKLYTYYHYPLKMEKTFRRHLL